MLASLTHGARHRSVITQRELSQMIGVSRESTTSVSRNRRYKFERKRNRRETQGSYSCAPTAEGVSDRQRQRHVLLVLDDHLLHDIGVSRQAAIEEGRKPFWKS
jgi:uncharacterized protein YjiS (DUF1127 family)